MLAEGLVLATAAWGRFSEDIFAAVQSPNLKPAPERNACAWINF